MPTMTPTEVLMMRTDLSRRLEDPEFAGYVKTANGWPDDVDAAMFSTLRSATRMGETFQVSEDMSRFTEFCAGELSGEEAFDPTLAPSTHGIVRFDRPIPLGDVRGATMLGHWLTWAPGRAKDGPKTVMMWFNDTREPDDVQLRIREMALDQWGSGSTGLDRLAAVTGRWAPCGAQVTAPGSLLGPEQTPLSASERAEVIADGGSPAQSVTNTTRVVYALWALLRETIVVTSPGQVQRAGRRMAKRMRLPESVTTVHLRHVSYTEPGPGSPVEWSHRWMVRGHWAWRASSEHAPGASAYEKGWRVRRWVSPYQKGPANAPLRIPDKVNRLFR